MNQYKAKIPIEVYVGPTKKKYKKGDPIDFPEDVVKSNFRPEWVEKISAKPVIKNSATGKPGTGQSEKAPGTGKPVVTPGIPESKD